MQKCLPYRPGAEGTSERVCIVLESRYIRVLLYRKDYLNEIMVFLSLKE